MAGERDMMIGKWNEMKGTMRNWWGQLTDDDWQEIQGNREKLLGKLEQRYGWSRSKAEEEYSRHMKEYEKQHMTR